jgi:PIN domain nuclease of toxin-antitoxin system
LKLLLDTHIWIWGVLEPERLRPRIQKELNDPDNERWLSPISTWEVLTLTAKKRLQLQRDTAEWIRQSTAPFREAPLTHEIALAARQLPFAHQDPADRFLAATAKVLGLTLVTADVNLLGLGDIATLANR